MKLPLYFISDCHVGMTLNDKEKKRREKLFFIFDKIKKTGGTLIIGGDFFDFWFDFKNYEPEFYHDIFLQLIDLQESGIKIHYVAGNHDYWDFGFISSKIEKFHKQDFNFNVNNQEILLTHGDGLLKNDVGYRFMKKILRHKIFMFLFRKLSPKLGYKIGQKVSKTSEEYNHFNDYADDIKKEILQYARKEWSKGRDVVLVGHYHQKEIIEEDSKFLIFLGDWLQHYSVTKFDGNNWVQFTWNEL